MVEIDAYYMMCSVRDDRSPDVDANVQFFELVLLMKCIWYDVWWCF